MIALTRFPPTRHAWRNMLLAVAGFGLFTLLFAYSNYLWLSLFTLAMTGACDSISVVIRQTILQIYPPENMRGRVAAVNGMFVSSSNEYLQNSKLVKAKLHLDGNSNFQPNCCSKKV